MKNAIATLSVALGIFILGTNASAHSTKIHFLGIDTSFISSGYLTAEYNGQTYHLTEGDTLAGQTVVLIDASDSEVIFKDSRHHLYEVYFRKVSR